MEIKIPQEINGLIELSKNYWWTWNEDAIELFRLISPRTFRHYGFNPVKLLHNIPYEILEKRSREDKFLAKYNLVYSRFKSEVNHDFKNYDICIFCAEFGVHHDLSIYAGGLGILTGDILKELSDLKKPAVGVGLMYRKGYTEQKLVDGWQEDTFIDNVKENPHLELIKDEKGNTKIFTLDVPNLPVKFKVWKVYVGNSLILLLDSNVEENPVGDRDITNQLYIVEKERRFRQILLLGLGGVRVLKELKIEPRIIHLNEEFPFPVVIELIKENIKKGMKIESAIDEVRKKCIFTTHTPIRTGHDSLPLPLIEQYLIPYCESFGLKQDALLKLASADVNHGFNSTHFCINTTMRTNAVSKKHMETVKKQWKFDWDHKKLTYITNGIHIPTWIAPEIAELLDRHLGTDWIRYHDEPRIWEGVDSIPDEELWETHIKLRCKLIRTIRDEARRKWTEKKISALVALCYGAFLEEDMLTLCFARRIVQYKRALLLFKNPARLKKLLNDPRTPIQVIFAGKAHPADIESKRTIQELFRFSQEHDFGGRIVFVENYDIRLAKLMVQGADVWLNTPIAPLEASGTSGMKAGLNGVLNLSVLDGWWTEGYNERNGWAFESKENEPNRDEKDAEKLYQTIEKKVIPAFYKNRSRRGIPAVWVKLMKESIKTIGQRFSARRMVKQYYFTEEKNDSRN